MPGEIWVSVKAEPRGNVKAEARVIVKAERGVPPSANTEGKLPTLKAKVEQLRKLSYLI